MYKREIVKIPAPVFYVVYTGKGSHPESLRLSDAFYEQVSFLELTVQVIDSGNAAGILAEFIDITKEIDAAVCGVKGQERINRIREIVKKYEDARYLLSSFLMEKGDVADMINDTLDYNDFLEIKMEEAMEQGREQGRGQGRGQGIILSGRKHALDDNIIIDDLMTEAGYSYESAVKELKEYDATARK